MTVGISRQGIEAAAYCGPAGDELCARLSRDVFSDDAEKANVAARYMGQLLQDLTHDKHPMPHMEDDQVEDLIVGATVHETLRVVSSLEASTRAIHAQMERKNG